MPPASVSSHSETRQRAHDRLAVEQARRRLRRARLFWLILGPGVLVMLGENDAPSMLSYAASGAKFGVGFFLPFVVVTFAMAFVAQEITVRLGAVSQTGHAELIYRRFGRFWGHFAMIDLMWTNFLTLVTEFVGMVAGASFFGVPAWAAVTMGVGVNLLVLTQQRYWRWERLALAMAVLNLVFVPVALVAHPDWGQVGTALWSWRPLPAGGFNSGTITLLLADIGATVTPWMLFFQQGAVSDKGLTPADVSHGRLDTLLGALLAALAALAAMIATAPLFLRHMNAGQYGAAQFAQALRPLLGQWPAALFALGIFEAGLVASLTISTSSAYALGEVTGWGHSLNRRLSEAPAFYGALVGMLVLAGGLLLLPHFPLEAVVILVNVIAVLTMPPAIGFLLLLVNDREVMGPHVNTRGLNSLGIGVGVFISAAGIVYALTVLWPGFRF